MKTRFQIQKGFLILLASAIFQISIAQSMGQSDKESYILTVNGEKIPIKPNEPVASYAKKISCVKPLNDTPLYANKSISVKAKEIEKIIDGDRLYIPVKYNSKRTCLARVIAEKSDFTLVSFLIMSNVGEDYRLFEHFGIINPQSELIEEGNMQGRSYNVDEHIKTISKYFGDCIDTSVLWDERKNTTWSEPKFLQKPKLIEEKTYNFLWNTNQLECQN